MKKNYIINMTKQTKIDITEEIKRLRLKILKDKLAKIKDNWKSVKTSTRNDVKNVAILVRHKEDALAAIGVLEELGLVDTSAGYKFDERVSVDVCIFPDESDNRRAIPKERVNKEGKLTIYFKYWIN